MNKWAEQLPQELLILIFNLLAVHDVALLRSVCKSWLLVLRKMKVFCPNIPWLMMLSNPNCANLEEEEEDRSYFSPFHEKIFSLQFPEIRGKRCCGSFNNSGGWLMTVDEKGEIQLFHPWRRIQLRLPHSSTFPLQYFRSIGEQPLVEIRDLDIHKAAMSDDGTTVVVIYDFWNLAFCRIGDEVWTGIKSSTFQYNMPTHAPCPYRDVIYHKGRFHTLTYNGVIGVCNIDFATPYVETLTEELPEAYSTTEKYLVPDSGSESMFIVLKVGFFDKHTKGFKASEFHVHEIGLEETGDYRKKPGEVKSLTDRVMYVGHNSSMLISTSKFSGFRGNCIHFTDSYWEGYLGLGACMDLGVFRFEDGTVERLFQDKSHPIFSPPIWITPPPHVFLN